jgi:hypothetical protein
VVGAGHLDGAALHGPGQRQRPGQQDVEAGRRLALLVGPLACLQVLDPAALGQPVELLVGQPVEQEQCPDLVRLQPIGHSFSK